MASAEATLHRALKVAAARLPELFAPGTRLVVGFSGGQDSTCLLHALSRPRMRLEVVAAHVDHALRPDSAETAARAEAAAAAMGVVCEVRRVDVAAYRRGLPAWSVQQAARAARYHVLARVAEEHQAAALLVAHTADDQAETVLLNLLRGSGLAGLAGMPLDESLDPRRLGPPPAELSVNIQSRAVQRRAVRAEGIRTEEGRTEGIRTEEGRTEGIRTEEGRMEAMQTHDLGTPDAQPLDVQRQPVGRDVQGRRVGQDVQGQPVRQDVQRRRVRLARPLLKVMRATTLTYCAEAGLTVIEDVSNQSRDFTRNRVRLDLLPALERYNPGIREVLARTADLAGEDLDALDAVVDGIYAGLASGVREDAVELDLRLFRAQPRALQRRLLRRGLRSLLGTLVDVRASPIEDALEVTRSGAPGLTYHLPRGVELCIGSETMLLRLYGKARRPNRANTWDNGVPRL